MTPWSVAQTWPVKLTPRTGIALDANPHGVQPVHPLASFTNLPHVAAAVQHIEWQIERGEVGLDREAGLSHHQPAEIAIEPRDHGQRTTMLFAFVAQRRAGAPQTAGHGALIGTDQARRGVLHPQLENVPARGRKGGPRGAEQSGRSEQDLATRKHHVMDIRKIGTFNHASLIVVGSVVPVNRQF